MLIVEINSYSYGSTGRIMMQIAARARQNGHRVITYSTTVFTGKRPVPREKIHNHCYFSSYFENFMHYALAQVTDGNGFFSIFATFRLIHQLNKLQPDVLQLHNLHQFCINLPILFRYIKRNKIRTVWTFHDCWAFTGHCMHFDDAGCNRWKSGCGDCPQRYHDPRSRVDWSHKRWKKKCELFSSLDTLTIVTPSEWLAELAQQSFLKKQPVVVINNGIDTSVFTPKGSNFRKDNGLEEKYIVLGVASYWNRLKGLDIFVQLSKDLNEKYVIVLVGLDEHMAKSMPSNILSIGKTNSQRELAEIYTVADVFVNPTKEDTFPTVNMEALACGTPVATFYTGGSPEILDSTCGIAIEKNDYESMKREIIRICENKPFQSDDCVKRAAHFQMEKKYDQYIALYESMTDEDTL